MLNNMLWSQTCDVSFSIRNHCPQAKLEELTDGVAAHHPCGGGPLKSGTHGDAGKWAQHLLPLGKSLHIFRVYGCSTDVESAPEFYMELRIEFFSAVVV
eukprot:4474472-Amphidinium_carterae.1